MAIAFDASSAAAAAGTGTLGWTHTPVGTPRGIILLVGQNAAFADQISAAPTYGGVNMTEVALSPVARDGTEDGIVYGYHLGASIPTGPQAVSIAVSGAASKWAAVFSVTAAQDTSVVDTTALTGSLTDPSGTLSLGGIDCFCAMGLWSAINDVVANCAPLANWTSSHELDLGTGGVVMYRYNIIGSADVTFGATTGTTNDTAALGIAIREDAAAGGFAYSQGHCMG